MASRGAQETDVLRRNVEDQLNRLLMQMNDLEELKDELDAEEIDTIMADTNLQLREFQEYLDKVTQGNMTLVDEFNSVQLAIRAAISQAFKTPEVIRMFAQKQPRQLRAKLADFDRDHKLGKIATDDYVARKVEVLTALKKLGERLSTEESSYLSQNMTRQVAEFEQANDDLAQDKLLSVATSQIKDAQN